MKEIIIKRFERHERLMIRLFFQKDVELIRIARDCGYRWNWPARCWEKPYSARNLEKIIQAFKAAGTLKVEGFDRIEEKKSRPELLKLSEWMKAKRYSERSIHSYLNCLEVFLHFSGEKPISELNNDDVKKFNSEYILAKKLSASYQGQFINALKLLYRVLDESALSVEKLDRPRKAFQLPDVLSVQEVAKIIKSTENLKHRCMLSLCYSAGLRRSEIINLKLQDIDSSRMLIFIKSGKGNKDRIVPLSPAILELLRTYYVSFKPSVYLFEGQDGYKYSERSLSQVFSNVLSKSGIAKQVSLHSLRHSYATHLLETGTDLRYIQELLGHKSPRTTQIYTHVSTQAISRIKSPFDSLNLDNEK